MKTKDDIWQYLVKLHTAIEFNSCMSSDILERLDDLENMLIQTNDEVINLDIALKQVKRLVDKPMPPRAIKRKRWWQIWKH